MAWHFTLCSIMFFRVWNQPVGSTTSVLCTWGEQLRCVNLGLRAWHLGWWDAITRLAATNCRLVTAFTAKTADCPLSPKGCGLDTELWTVKQSAGNKWQNHQNLQLQGDKWRLNQNSTSLADKPKINQKTNGSNNSCAALLKDAERCYKMPKVSSFRIQKLWSHCNDQSPVDVQFS